MLPPFLLPLPSDYLIGTHKPLNLSHLYKQKTKLCKTPNAKGDL